MKKAILLLALGCGDDLVGDTAPDQYVDTAPEAPEWSCLGEAPLMAEREPGRVQYVVPVVDFDSSAAVPDLQVQVCVSASCLEEELPLCGVGLEPCYQVTTDVNRPFVLTFDLPFGFDGVLRFGAPGYVDLDYVLGGPMVGTPDGEMTVTGKTFPMLSVHAIDTVYQSLGQPEFDPARGVLMATVVDCLGLRAQDVSIHPIAGNFDGSSVPYSLSSSNILTPDSLRTDPRGVAGFINLPPDAVTVGVNAPNGEEYARSTVVVRANAITLAELRSGLGVWGQ